MELSQCMLNSWAHLSDVVHVACVRHVHWLHSFITKAHEALFHTALYRPPHTLCPALVQKLTLPDAQHVSVVKETLQILQTQTEHHASRSAISARILLIHTFIDFMQAGTSDIWLWYHFALNKHLQTPWWIHSRCPAEAVWWRLLPVVLKQTDPVTQLCVSFFFFREKKTLLKKRFWWTFDVCVEPFVVLSSRERACVPFQPPCLNSASHFL